ncbi:MAG: CopG family transcriptional regulator [Armatimonadota bacterium]|jgi:post-segregation antitoxin (ccd killing protein)
MVRTQIQLTEEQAAELKRLAAERGVSVAEVVRGFVDKGMRASRGMSWEERKRRALAVVGKYRSSTGDLSVRHDEYFAEASEQ